MNLWATVSRMHQTLTIETNHFISNLKMFHYQKQWKVDCLQIFLNLRSRVTWDKFWSKLCSRVNCYIVKLWSVILCTCTVKKRQGSILAKPRAFFLSLHKIKFHKIGPFTKSKFYLLKMLPLWFFSSLKYCICSFQWNFLNVNHKI